MHLCTSSVPFFLANIFLSFPPRPSTLPHCNQWVIMPGVSLSQLNIDFSLKDERQQGEEISIRIFGWVAPTIFNTETAIDRQGNFSFWKMIIQRCGFDRMYDR